MIVTVFLLVLFIALLCMHVPATIASHWQHFYDNQQISSDDFYERIKEGFAERQISALEIQKVSILQTHIFSERRVYLKIQQSEHIWYVCAAPFGTGTFISWWLCKEDERYFNRIPVVSKVLGLDRRNKTFYQMDTEGMFKSAIHATVAEAADAMTAEKGIRLSELERQYAVA